MAITGTVAGASRCRKCARLIRGQDRVLLVCLRCFERGYRNPCDRGGPRPPDLDARIRYYQRRASEGLPLSDPPFAEG